MLIRKNQLTNQWPFARLDEVTISLDSRRKPITAKDRVAGPYPYYGANGQQDSVADYIFDEPLILLAEDGGHFGDSKKKIAYQVDGKCWVNNHAHVLRPKPEVDIRYLCRYLEKFDVTPFITGTTRGKLTKTAANRIPVPVPPIAEQRRIAAILDKADAVRRKRKEAIALTEELLRSAFLEMFGDPAVNPKGWKQIQMKEIVQETQYGTSAKANSEQNGFPVLRMNNLTYSGEINLTDLKWCPLLASEEAKYTTCKGDLLFNRTNSPDLVGKTAVWRSQDRYAIAGYLFRVRFQEDLALSEYVSAYLNSSHGKKYIFQKAKPSNNMSNFSATEFRRIPILLPPIELQKKFSIFVDSVRSKRSPIDASLKDSENLFNSLLQRAFRGDL